MANHLHLIVLIVSIAAVVANSLDRVTSNQVEQDENILFTDESFPREDWIKIVQSHLLQQLNLSEDALEAGPRPKLSNYVVRLLEDDKERDQHEQKAIIRPINNIFACFGSDEGNCSRFEFEISSEWNTVDGRLRVWFRKEQRTSPLDITVFFSGISNVYHYDESNLDVIVELGRIGFSIMKPSTAEVRGTVHCTIEARGSSVHKEDEDGPILVVSRPLEPVGRQRRSSSSSRSSANCNCCVVDRNVTAAELRMDRVIIYPAVMNLKACRGRCRVDQGAFNMSYGSVMYNIMKHNASAMESLEEFWVPRCYPSRMKSMGIFYVDNVKNQIVRTNVDAMVVDSCSCMSYRCYSHR